MKSRRVYVIVSLADNKINSQNDGKLIFLYEDCNIILDYNYFLPVYVDETLKTLRGLPISKIFVDQYCQIPLIDKIKTLHSYIK